MSNKNNNANLVVIGGGGAGMAAAVAAAESGLGNIVVLEKRGSTGGTSAMASGPFGAESPAQRRQAIIARKDDLFKIAMRWSHLKANPRIVRAFIDKSGDTIRWLEEKGLYFRCVPHSPIDLPLTWHVSKGNGAEIMKVLAGECQRLGIKVLLRTSAMKMTTGNEDGNIQVLAEREDEKKTVTVSTRSVIISTGGFGGNHELLKRLCPEYRDTMRLSGLPNTGEGIQMATEIGAANDGLGMIMVAGPVSGGVLRVGDGPDIVPLQMTFISGEPSAIWVNNMGRRFIDETVVFNYYESINALIRQPEATCYALLDTGLISRIAENGLSNVPSGYEYGEPQRSPLPPGLERELKTLSDKGVIKMAESWTKIAEWIGADAEILQTTIDEYNSACENGHDLVFAKDREYLIPLKRPPYYAIKCGSGLLNTMGGIKVNERMEVLDQSDKPIRGCYAAGVDTGGWTSDTYCAILPGTAFGYALNSGRIAGENAAKFVLGL